MQFRVLTLAMLAMVGVGCGNTGDMNAPKDAAAVDGSVLLDAPSNVDAAACDPSQATCPCDNGTCAGGLMCVGGLCINACNFSYECGAGAVCADGACVPACSGITPCSPGLRCVGGACLPDTANPECGASMPCSSGETCDPSGLCASSCTATSQCGPNEVCAGATQTCMRDPSIKPTCAGATSCPGGQVCSDGFCRFACSTLSDCTSIDPRFVACDTDVCETNAEVNPECTLQMPCAGSMHCISNTCI